MPAGITVFIDGLNRTVQIATPQGTRQLELFYASIGGDPALPPGDKLAIIVRRLGKYIVDGAEDAKRAGYLRDAEVDNAADGLGTPLGDTG
jgi:hypothetical protein